MSDRPTRVSFFIDNLSRAGTETQLLALIRTLDRSRVEPSLAMLDGTTAESLELAPTDCKLIRLGLKTFSNLRATARAARRLMRFWKRRQADIVQTYFLDSTYFGVPLARAAGIPHVIRVRNNLGHWVTPAHLRLGRIVGRMAHSTLTNSEPGRLALRDSEQLDESKIDVLENGVDLDRFTTIPPPSRTGGVTIGTLANLRPVKGVDVLLRAFRLVADQYPTTRLLIAGDGEQRDELEALATSLGLTSQVTFLGRVSDVPRFLAEIDVAVMPSRAEGMSNAILEFMAAGRPLVATAVGATPKLLMDGTLGMLVPPGDEGLLAEALMQLISDEDYSAAIAETARGHVHRHFGRDAMCRRFEAYYRRLAA